MNILARSHLFFYTGSLIEKKENNLIYAELIGKLKEHPFVLELEEEIIPEYNQEFSGQKAINIVKVLLSQEKYEEYWYSSFKDSIAMGHKFNFDIYVEEIFILLKKYWEQEQYYERTDCSCY